MVNVRFPQRRHYGFESMEIAAQAPGIPTKNINQKFTPIRISSGFLPIFGTLTSTQTLTIYHRW